MSLGKQATSLGLMHAADVLQPLLVTLYAGNVFAPVHFGQFVYALSISQIAVTFVDYGFHWTGQRAAAVMKQNPELVASLLAEVIATKLLLFVLVIGGMSALSRGLHLVDATAMIAAVVATAGAILFTPWLFIALDRAWQAAAAVVVSRIVALVGFVTLIKSPSQLPLAVALQASIPLIAALVALPYLFSVGLWGAFELSQLPVSRHNCATDGAAFSTRSSIALSSVCQSLWSNISVVTSRPASTPSRKNF